MKNQKISQALKTLGSLQNISLSFYHSAKLSDKGVENLSQDLKKLTKLQIIDLQFPACERITGTGFKIFGQNLTLTAAEFLDQ